MFPQEGVLLSKDLLPRKCSLLPFELLSSSPSGLFLFSFKDQESLHPPSFFSSYAWVDATVIGKLEVGQSIQIFGPEQTSLVEGIVAEHPDLELTLDGLLDLLV